MKIAILRRFSLGITILDTDSGETTTVRKGSHVDVGGGLFHEGKLMWCSNDGITSANGIEHEVKYASPHSLIEHNGELIVSDTKTNSVKNHEGKVLYTPSFLKDNSTTMDFIHLNDCIMVEDRMLLSSISRHEHWRKGFSGGGLWYSDNEDLYATIKIPHTPCVYDNRIYVLETGTGRLLSYAKNLSDKTVVKSGFKGFLRGLIIKDGYAYIASSAFNADRSFGALEKSKKLHSATGRIFKMSLDTLELEVIFEQEGGDFSSICIAE